MSEIEEFLKSHNAFKRSDNGFYIENAYETSDYSYRVELDSNCGYAWELLRFDDSDRDGVATARWVSIDGGVEGDTLEELKAAVSKFKIAED